MAEAVLTRAVIPEKELTIVPGYHSILVTIKSGDNKVVPNFPVFCKDGSVNYNYTTNSKGQVLFMVNSGAANIYANNVINSVTYIDFIGNSKNIDAPAGSSTKVELILKNGQNYYEYTSSKKFGIGMARNVNLTLIGGGGGGGSGCGKSGVYLAYGGGGGAGYMNNYNSIIMGPMTVYNFQCGAGGKGGMNPANQNTNGNSGNTGGTSYLVGTDYSAIGGSGGGHAIWRSSGSSINGLHGTGGLGNGAGRYVEMGNLACEPPENASVDFAGGGGGGFSLNGVSYMVNENGSWLRFRGHKYGGGYDENFDHVVASRGGGGMGGYICWNIGNYSNDLDTKSAGYHGGAGLMRINIYY